MTRRNLLIVACAASAGVHAALAPQHFDESAAAGAGFVVATILLAALAVGFTVRTPTRLAVIFAIVTLAGLLVAYLLAVTSGVPVLMPQREAVDGLALATKAVEVLGLVAAFGLLQPQPVTRHEGATA